MSKNPLDERRTALEEAFFAKHNEQLLARMREADAERAAREGLAAAGVKDPALIDRLVSLGLRAETLAAVRVVPLVLVAWADGKAPPEERAAVMGGAAAAGIAPGSTAHHLLVTWLDHRPGPELAEAWQGYARALTADLPDAERGALRSAMLREARAVAEARGGFLGLGHRTSPQEAAVLHWIEAALGG